MQNVGKNVNTTTIVSKSVTVLAALVSLGLAPATGGASVVGCASMAGVSGLAALTTVGASCYKRIVDKGLQKKVQMALDKDEKMVIRLHAAADALRGMSSLAYGAAEFLTTGVQLGVFTFEEANTVLQFTETSRALVITSKVTQVTQKLNKVLRLTGSTFNAIAIPLEILSIIMDIKDCNEGSYSKNAILVWKKVEELIEEYKQVKEEAYAVLAALKDDAYLL